MAGKRNEWVKRKWNQLILWEGGRCACCPSQFFLEFCHIRSTNCRGMGRGKSRRLRDIMKYPGRYILLCMDCHDDFDGRGRRNKQSEIIDYL